MPQKPWPPEVINGALEMDVNIVPMGEALGDRSLALGVAALEVAQGLVGEHDAPAEGVVGAVALDDGDVVRRGRAASSGSRNTGRPGRRRYRRYA